MKNHLLTSCGYAFKILAVGLFCLSGVSTVIAEIEIDLDEASKPSGTVKWTPTPSNASRKIPVFTPTATPVPAKIETVSEPTPTPEPESDMSSEETEAKPAVAHPVSKMKDVYAEGIQSYKDKHYKEAVKYLTKAVNMRDKYTPKFYYAEAYATLGLIYQFHIVHPKTAYSCYQKALKYEKNNKTARKYIKQVRKMLNKRK